MPCYVVERSSHHHQFCCCFLQVVGLDLVDDESKPERRPTKHMPTPEQWTNVFNPAYAYYVYYCYANLYTLNKVSFICPQISACSPSNSSFQISFSLNIYDVLSPIGALLVDLRFLWCSFVSPRVWQQSNFVHTVGRYMLMHIFEYS